MQINPELDLVLDRQLKAPPHLVRRCWTDPQLFCQWYCRKPWHVSGAVLEMRAGGRFFMVMNGPKGQRFPMPSAAKAHETMGFSAGWGIAADQLTQVAKGL